MINVSLTTTLHRNARTHARNGRLYVLLAETVLDHRRHEAFPHSTSPGPEMLNSARELAYYLFSIQPGSWNAIAETPL